MSAICPSCGKLHLYHTKYLDTVYCDFFRQSWLYGTNVLLQDLRALCDICLDSGTCSSSIASLEQRKGSLCDTIPHFSTVSGELRAFSTIAMTGSMHLRFMAMINYLQKHVSPTWPLLLQWPLHFYSATEVGCQCVIKFLPQVTYKLFSPLKYRIWVMSFKMVHTASHFNM